MAYITNNSYQNLVGTRVILTQPKGSMAGYFTKDSEVTITDFNPVRGFTFTDDEGNSVSEAGFEGFTVVEQP